MVESATSCSCDHMSTKQRNQRTSLKCNANANQPVKLVIALRTTFAINQVIGRSYFLLMKPINMEVSNTLLLFDLRIS